MTILEFFFTFCMMILIGSPLIVGWYIVTRGQWYIQPDGRWKKYGMIFKEWSLFWEQTRQFRPERNIVYTGKELDKQLDLLAKVRPDLYTVTDAWRGPAKREFTKADLESIKNLLGCEIKRTGENEFFLYVIEPVYRFPPILRKPLSECPACMASVYGSLFYWFTVLQVPYLFSWSSKENLARLGFWVIFCITLACGNDYLSKKLKL